MIGKTKILFFILSTKAFAENVPIGRGAGLDCNFDELIADVKCSLTDGFLESFSISDDSANVFSSKSIPTWIAATKRLQTLS